MVKLGILLLVVLAVATMVVSGASTIPELQARKSRFPLTTTNPPLPSYECSKRSAAACLALGSPGPSCCEGRCVDTLASADHCGGCNKVCKHGRVCCRGRCVDLLSDKDNCGMCFNQCDKKCSYGFCDYAQ